MNGFDSFSANDAAKAAGATPFKRPENAQFLPGSGFKTFFFDPTGDTNADSGNQPELAARGAWGSIFRVDLDDSRDCNVRPMRRAFPFLQDWLKTCIPITSASSNGYCWRTSQLTASGEQRRGMKQALTSLTKNPYPSNTRERA